MHISQKSVQLVYLHVLGMLLHPFRKFTFIEPLAQRIAMKYVWKKNKKPFCRELISIEPAERNNTS